MYPNTVNPKWGFAKNTNYVMEGRPKLWSFFLILVEQ